MDPLLEVGPHPVYRAGLTKRCCVCRPSSSADCFKGLDLLVKNYLAAVPLIGDLRSPAMRPRHWQALQDATKVKCSAL